MFDTTDLTRQLLTAACGLADAPGEPASKVLRSVADDAADSPTRADVFQRVAIVAAMALGNLAQVSGHPRDELLALALRGVADHDDTDESRRW